MDEGSAARQRQPRRRGEEEEGDGARSRQLPLDPQVRALPGHCGRAVGVRPLHRFRCFYMRCMWQ